MFIKRKIKNLVRYLSRLHWRTKCKYFLILEGTEDLTRIIEHLPKMHLIPILRMYGAQIGDNCDIDRGLILHRTKGKKPFKNLFIGNNVHLGYNMLIDLTSKVIIGDDCAFGANCQIWTHTGDWAFDRSDEHDKINPVKIGKGVICYSGVIISQRVSIGEYTRVGAGSIVLKNLESKAFYAGVPAKLIKKISGYALYSTDHMV